MKKTTIFLIFFLFFISANAEKQIPIKVAILDNYNSEMPFIPLAYKYETAYLQGIKTAEYTAQEKKYIIDSKFFFHGNGPIDIFKSIPLINDWKADVVIGPSSSDKFIMLKNELPNIMVLSSYASGIKLKNLPRNFYSTFLSDDKLMYLLGKFVQEKFTQKNIYLIEQVDCKQCVDAGKLFIQSYKKINPNIKIVENKTILDNVNTINSKKLILGHENDVILIFNSTYYDYNLLTRHIADDFPNKKLIFVSDQDNWRNEVDGRSHPFDLTYESYRIGPILFDQSMPEFKIFVESYVALYHTKPEAALTYMTYVTIMSILEALRQYPSPNSDIGMREKILYSYETALKNNPNWYKNTTFGIYQLTSKGEVLIKKLAITNTN